MLVGLAMGVARCVGVGRALVRAGPADLPPGRPAARPPRAMGRPRAAAAVLALALCHAGGTATIPTTPTPRPSSLQRLEEQHAGAAGALSRAEQRGQTAPQLRCDAGQNCSVVLQSAIDRATVPGGGGAVSLAPGVWEVVPIVLRAHLLLELSTGTTIIAQRGAFHGGSDALLSAGCGPNPSVTNLTIRGAPGGGSRLAMRRADYANPALYAHSEDRCALCLSEVVGARILDILIEDTGGDGVYIAGGYHSPSTDVELLRVTTVRAYRNGLSVTNARDVVVRDCSFLNTSGTPPEAGVDLEPNTATDYMQNVTFVNIQSRGNVGPSFSVALAQLQCKRAKCKLKPDCMCPLHPPEVSVALRGGVLQGAASLGLNTSALVRGLTYNIGVLVGAGSSPNGSQGTLTFEDLAIIDTAQPGLEFEDKAALSMPTVFRNCSWRGVATSRTVRWGGQNVPLLLHQSAPGAIGGVTFDGCSVSDTERRPWLKCDSCGGQCCDGGVCTACRKGPAMDLRGTVAVHNPHGCVESLGANATGISLRATCKKTKAVAAVSRLPALPSCQKKFRWVTVAESVPTGHNKPKTCPGCAGQAVNCSGCSNIVPFFRVCLSLPTEKLVSSALAFQAEHLPPAAEAVEAAAIMAMYSPEGTGTGANLPGWSRDPGGNVAGFVSRYGVTGPAGEDILHNATCGNVCSQCHCPSSVPPPYSASMLTHGCWFATVDSSLDRGGMGRLRTYARDGARSCGSSRPRAAGWSR